MQETYINSFDNSGLPLRVILKFVYNKKWARCSYFVHNLGSKLIQPYNSGSNLTFLKKC